MEKAIFLAISSAIITIALLALVIFTQNYFLNPMLDYYYMDTIFEEDEGRIWNALSVMIIPLIFISVFCSNYIYRKLYLIGVETSEVLDS